MAIRWTSRLALAQIEQDLRGLRLEVYLAIKRWDPADHGPGPSIEDLARVLKRKESSICGRLAELKEVEAIEEAPLKVNRSGKEAMTYRALAYREPPAYVADSTGQVDFFTALKSE